MGAWSRGIEEDLAAKSPPSGRGLQFASYFAVIAAGTWLAALWNPFWEHSLTLFGVFALASLAWAAAVFSTRRGVRSTRWIVLGAVVLRVVALAGDPGLSDDVNRYVWEGSLVADGISPYALAPAAEEYAERRVDLADTYAALNNQEISAAYPPFVEEVFGLIIWSARLVGEFDGQALVRIMRAFFTLCDLLVLWPLARLLKRFGRPNSGLIVWAWCPLITLEFAGSGHFDSLGVLVLLGALALLTAGVEARGWKDKLGAVLLSASVFIKLLPICTLPFVLRGERRNVRAVWFVLASLLWFVPLALWEGGSSSLDRGLTEYGTRWEGFNFFYSWIEQGIEGLFGGERDRSVTDPRILGRAVIGAVWMTWLAVLVIRKREPVRATGELVALFILLTPTVHPWYLAWVLPFAALRLSWAWLWITAASVVMYAPLEAWNLRAEWTIPAWTWPVLAIPPLLLFLFARNRESLA